MEYERKGVTIIWEIENVKYLHEKGIYTPAISVDELDGTNWRLELYCMTDSAIRLALVRAYEDNGPSEFGLDYEFSAQTPHGKHLGANRSCSSTFTNGLSSPEIELFEDEPYDSIIVRCQMWPRRRCISRNCHFSIHSPIKREQWAFEGIVENFSDLSVGVKKALKTVSPSDGKEVMSVDFRLGYQRGCVVFGRRRTYLKIDINSNQDFPSIDFQVLFLDSVGNKLNLGKSRNEFNVDSSGTFILPVTKEKLIENAARYLPNDTLTLHCELTVFNYVKHEKSKTIEPETDSYSEAGSSKAVEALTKTVNIPCDVMIQTVSETFAAHSEVLSAQSPVFEAMFRTNLKESVDKCIDVGDVEAETVNRMLVFLYSATLEKLDWKDAVKLYVAADKYQILSLKQSCSSLLEQNVHLSNCVVLLRLADIYQDDNLKSNVQDFVAENMPQVLHCDQWKELETDYPQIAIQLSHVLLRKHKLA